MRFIIAAVIVSLLSVSAWANDIQSFERKNFQTVEGYCAEYSGIAGGMVTGLLYSRSIGNSAIQSHQLVLQLADERAPTFQGLSTKDYARRLADTVLMIVYDAPDEVVENVDNEQINDMITDKVMDMIYPRCIQGFHNQGF